MTTIKSRLIRFLSLASIVPVVVLGLIVYVHLSRVFHARLVEAETRRMEVACSHLERNLEKIEWKLSLLATADRLQKVLIDIILRTGEAGPRGTFFPDEAVAIRQHFEMVFIGDNRLYVNQAFLLPVNGGCFGYFGNLTLEQQRTIKESVQYKSMIEADGTIAWIVSPADAERSSLYAGIALKNFLAGQVPLGENLGVLLFRLSDTLITEEFSFDQLSARGSILRVIDQEGVEMMSMGSHGAEGVPVIGRGYLAVGHTLGTNGWHVVEYIPKRYFRTDLTGLIWIYATGLATCLAVISLLSYAIAKRITDPLHLLAEGMKRLGGRDFTVSVNVDTEDETRFIVQAFNTMVRELERLFNKAVEAEKEKRLAAVEALYYQINPHFLYNTLASIYLTAVTDKQTRIAEMVRVLSRLLRNTLSHGEDTISVREEIRNLADYIAVHQIRYSDMVSVEIAVSDNLHDRVIPKMVLQPVVENAFMHGFADLDSDQSTTGYQPCLRIGGDAGDDHVVFHIHDNGRGMTRERIDEIMRFDGTTDPPGSYRHIGLRNIHRRIQGLYGPDYGILIESTIGESTTVTLTLPDCRVPVSADC